MVRPSFILGGAGTGIALDEDHLARLAAEALYASPVTEVLVEQSIAGQKEFELEVMRDNADNCVVICSIENVDPMGVHTGDSITVAPAQTLTDVEYQTMRDASFACIRRVGVETGGSNVQFAVDPVDGRQMIIEMNPRVSRSSALASKATGFPIAKIAARLAVGYRLDEIQNDITGATPASFEPTIDYVVTKIPRWAFEKLPGSTDRLGTRMQSVGEVMGIGRTFPESLQKAVRSLEQGRDGLNGDPAELRTEAVTTEELRERVVVATPERLFALEALLRRGEPVEQLAESTGIDPWFVSEIARIATARMALGLQVTLGVTVDDLDRRSWRTLKRLGFSDRQLAYLFGNGTTEQAVRSRRLAVAGGATFKTVDTCGAEFEARTPYHYSTTEDEDEVAGSSRPRVIILGSGPNRIGQGIEFDYCCVHASLALRAAGYETVMVNCNPETVSTDYDTSDRLYFEPLTDEDLANIVEAEQTASEGDGRSGRGDREPRRADPAQAGRRARRDAGPRHPPGVDRPRRGPRAVERAVRRPRHPPAARWDRAHPRRRARGRPVGRLSGARASRPTCSAAARWRSSTTTSDCSRRSPAMTAADGALGREGGVTAERPVLVDRFLEDAVEVDVDAVRDSTGEVLIGGVMEHVEEAGVHSGDSACALPPQTLRAGVVAEIERVTRTIAEALQVRGLCNVQFAVKEERVYVLEANPRASRTVPFVAKATGVPLAMVAARVMVGATLAELRTEGLLTEPVTGHVSVKEAVLPFNRFPGVDTILGPEMRSTGEVMGIGATFGLAFAKSQMAAGNRLPVDGTVFLSLADRDKPAGLDAARQFAALGFDLAATSGTASWLERNGLPVSAVVAKVGDQQPGVVDAVDLIASGKVQLVVNTPRGRGPRADGDHIRAAAVAHQVPCVTTVAAARAAAGGIADWVRHPLTVRSLQEYHRR